MKKRLVAIGVLFLASGVSAQELRRTGLYPVTSPIRKVALSVDPQTGVATRIPESAPTGAIVAIYDNTCASGYYFGLNTAAGTGGTASEAFIDEGRVPDSLSTTPGFCTFRSAADTYNVQVYQIGYCTSIGAAPTAVIWCWDPVGGGTCSNNHGGVLPPAVAPSLAMTVTGLPGSQAPGSLACYAADIFLDAGFTLPGTTDSSNRFTWGFQMPLTSGSDGPLIAGNPNFGGCPPCVGTIWETGGQSTRPGTGMDTVDAFRIETFGGTGAGCFFFGSVPFVSFWLELQGTANVAPIATPFCDASDGALASCPCAAGLPETGCEIAQGTGGVLLFTVSQDTLASTAQMAATGYPSTANPSAILIRGNNQEVLPVPFGDGLRCVGTTGFARLHATTVAGGASTHTLSHGVGPGTFFYQVWFRNTPMSYCVSTGPSGGAFNLSNGQALTW